MTQAAGVKSRQLLAWLWSKYLHKHLWLLLAALFFMALEGSTLGALSWMMKPMFDQVFIAGDHGALWLVGLAIMLIFITRALASVGQKALLALISQRSAADMRVEMLDHLMRLDGSFHQTHPPGFLIQRVQADVEAVGQVWNAVITGAGRDLIALIILMGVAVSVDWQWTLVACIGTPIMVLPSQMVQGFVRRRAREARDLGAKLATRLDEVFHGIVPVKLNRLESYQSQRYRDLTGELVTADVKAKLGAAAIPGLIDVMAGLGFLGVLVFGGAEIISGEKTIGQFMSFFTAIGFAFEPLRRLGAVTGVWQNAAAAIERIKELLDTKPALVSPAQPKPAPLGMPEIRLSGVELSYGDTPVLNGTTLVAPAGKTTALVGASGAGKSTIFNLLTRLVDPQTGSVTIGGVAASDMTLADLRGLFSVVSQDAALFDETLKENILLGRSDVSDEQLNKVLEAAHVTDFLPKLPDGLLSPVGPRGSNLSGGQRQRVAIARALLRDTPILLLDEATSALDAQSEKVVQDALDQLSRGRTTLVIAHRLSTVRNADKIVVMDKGRVVDEGTHDELLARGGIYADLHKLQFKTEGPTADKIAQDRADRRRKDSAKGSKGSAPRAGTSLLSRISRRLFGR
ncbi:ABC transporter ATP-binding protein [Thalassovita aquimarina]|uniref:ABC transporter ATP-binding protein n=1 Tax=Thalassovita aquimarina TaxID=2785917 RepID=UPI001FED13C5|nr:ABC transporter ATP-binding protein [Thalassovita aquimarina]